MKACQFFLPVKQIANTMYIKHINPLIIFFKYYPILNKNHLAHFDTIR